MFMSKERESGSSLSERCGAKAKPGVILRLCWGESMHEVTREIQVPVHEIETWRKNCLDAGIVGLKRTGADPNSDGAGMESSLVAD